MPRLVSSNPALSLPPALSGITPLYLRHQEIRSRTGGPLATEVLIDFDRMTVAHGDHWIRPDILQAYCGDVLSSVGYLSSMLDQVLRPDIVLPAGKVFINLERSSVTQRACLKLVISAAEHLRERGCELVVELTEREMQCRGLEYLKGLQALKQAGVALAVDDYDFLAGDERQVELSAGCYDIVKVLCPVDHAQWEELRWFCRDQAQAAARGVVIECVEHSWEYNNAKTLPHVFGLQGYHFSRPVHWPEARANLH